MNALPVTFTAVEATRANAACIRNINDGDETTIYKLTIATNPNWEVNIVATDPKIASRFFYELSRQAEYLGDAASLRVGIQLTQDNA